MHNIFSDWKTAGLMYYPQKEQESQNIFFVCVGTYVHAILCIRVTILNAKKTPLSQHTNIKIFAKILTNDATRLIYTSEFLS